MTQDDKDWLKAHLNDYDFSDPAKWEQMAPELQELYAEIIAGVCSNAQSHH